MEKLIKLINKWQEEKHPDGIYLPVFAYRDWIFWSDSDCLSSVMDEIHLISKPCSFIKRLVDNDKIDLENLQCVFSWNINKWKTLMEETDGYERYEWTEYEATESLLMLLAIQDEPIEYLVSILK